MSGASGFIVDALHGNWALFFVITALMVMPSLILLVYVGRLLRERIKHWEAEKTAADEAARRRPRPGPAGTPDKGQPAPA